MSIGPVILMLAMTALMCGMVATYERILERTRAERDELLDILDANIDDMRRLAQERHPVNYGGGNLRIVK
jgi:hypothetical protein